jgi:hypothetical protein
MESLLMAGFVWIIHGTIAGSPAVAAYLKGIRSRWKHCLALVSVPFWCLLPAQVIWPAGGFSSYFTRLLILTVVVFVAELIAISPLLRRAATWRHWLLLVLTSLAVVPIQWIVPAYPD